MKKLFGGLNITWPKLVIFAIISAIYTALMAIIPVFSNSSFTTICETFEVWILFGIIIIMNSKSNKDAALKCFVFFLISQPLIYLIQVPFSWQGWGLFKYYYYWFIWTILCLPMGYIGYYMKKNKWWGYLILLPMIMLTALSLFSYSSLITYCFPKYILITLFCIAMMIIYPLYIFDNKKIKTIGISISCFLILIISIYSCMNQYTYSTEILSSGGNNIFDNTYKVELEDSKYGNVSIKYIESIEDYMIHADFKREGNTKLYLISPDGTKKEFNVKIMFNKYDVE